MQATVLDTLRYANRLKDAGVQAVQAEAMALAINDELVSGLATRDNIDHAASGLKADIDQAVSALRGELDRTAVDLRGEMGELRGELERTAADLRGEMGELRAELACAQRQIRYPGPLCVPRSCVDRRAGTVQRCSTALGTGATNGRSTCRRSGPAYRIRVEFARRPPNPSATLTQDHARSESPAQSGRAGSRAFTIRRNSAWRHSP